MGAIADDEMVAIPPGRVTLSDRRTRRTWSVDVEPYLLRGGGWFDEHWSCRASVRRRSHPSLQIDDVGLRLARSVPC